MVRRSDVKMDRLVLLIAVVALVCGTVCGVQVHSKMKSFSNAIKAGTMPADVEKVLYEYEAETAGMITEQWFTGLGVMNENMRIRIYIDGEIEPSLDFMLFMAHGIGVPETDEAQYTPWATKRIGHDADGALYNTYRIPFSRSFRVTAKHPIGGLFWYIIRGVEGMPVVIGDMQLPAGTRLKLYKNTDVYMESMQFMTLAKKNNTAGMLYQVTLSASSNDFTYLEACFRAQIDSEDGITWLSSGTEDFFLSGYYFNRGVYHSDNSGLTYRSNPGTMTAYKFFESDPIFFSKSFELIWRCGDTNNVDDGCPSDWPAPKTQRKGYTIPMSAPTHVTAYVWIYEYDI